MAHMQAYQQQLGYEEEEYQGEGEGEEESE